MAFTNKRILILSPQSWGKMHLSKHHYAIELARAGNVVYFLNPPEMKATSFPGRFRVYNSSTENLFLIEHRLYFPYRIKFHAIGIFHWLMHFHIRQLLRTLKQPFDIIWSFDLGNLYPFRLFGSRPLKLFHPVDEPLNKTAIDSAAGAQIIFSVTKEILAKYEHLKLPSYFINHGVSGNFFQHQKQTNEKHVCVGFSGNLTRSDIDRPVLLTIIQQHPSVEFHFWGSYNIHQSNISGTDDKATRDFIQQLEKLPNVFLHGPVPSAELAKQIHEMDAFLICYDVQRDQSKGTNYHKIMEYLSTGKVIVSNNVTTYQHQPDLVKMVSQREHNDRLPELFDEVIRRLPVYNSPELQSKRIAYANDNLYPKQVERIGDILISHGMINS